MTPLKMESQFVLASNTTWNRILAASLLILAVGFAAQAQSTFQFPQITDGSFGDLFYRTAIFISNPATTGSATVTLTFTTSSGEPFDIPFLDSTGQVVNSGNTITIAALGPGESRKFLSTGQSVGRIGFATVTSTAPIEANAVFSLFSGKPEEAVLINETAVPPSVAATDQSILVDESGGFRTAFAYANPSSTDSASLTFSLIDQAGTIVLTTTAELLPLQQTALFVNQLFASVGTTSGHVGSLKIVGETPVSVVALRFLGKKFTSMLSIGSGQEGQAFYFPHVADGDFGGLVYKTTILLANPATSGSATVTIALTSQTGTPLDITFADTEGLTVNTGNTITIATLGPGESRKLISTGVSTASQGFATVSSSAPIAASAIFSMFSGTPSDESLVSEAAVPQSASVTNQGIFVDQSPGFQTAFAYANPSLTTTANVRSNPNSSQFGLISDCLESVKGQEIRAKAIRPAACQSMPAAPDGS